MEAGPKRSRMGAKGPAYLGALLTFRMKRARDDGVLGKIIVIERLPLQDKSRAITG